MDQYTGADSLVLQHTGATTPGAAQPDPGASIGGYVSATRATWLSFIARESMRGLRITYVSPACGEGPATITATSSDELVFAAPNGAPGTPTIVYNGQSKQLIDGVDPGKYVIVERVSDVPLAGGTTLDLRETWHNVLIGPSKTEPDVGDQHLYRSHAIILRNASSSPLDDVRVWTPAVAVNTEQPEQVLPSGWPNPDLGSDVILPSTVGWHPHTRFLSIFSATGQEHRASIQGILRPAADVGLLEPHSPLFPSPYPHSFQVLAHDSYDRGLGAYGGAPDDRVVPVSGLRLSTEELAGAPEALHALADQYDHMADWSGAPWNYGYNEQTALVPQITGYAPGEFAPGAQLGLWFNIPLRLFRYARGYAAPRLLATLAWQFRIGTTVYRQTARVHYRWGEPQRRRIYLESTTPSGERVGLSHANTLPITVALPPDATTRVRCVAVNGHSLDTLLGEETYVLAGGEEVLPAPSPPVGLTVVQDALTVLVAATYLRTADGDAAADTWHVRLTQDRGGPPPTETEHDYTLNPSDVTHLEATIELPDGVAEGTLAVDVYVSRGDPAVNSDPASTTITLDGTTPDTPVPVHHLGALKELLP